MSNAILVSYVIPVVLLNVANDVKTMLGQREASEQIIIGLASCSNWCSIRIPLISLRHKTPTVAPCHALCFLAISISR